MPGPNKIYRRLWRWARWLPRPASPAFRRLIFGAAGGALLLAGVLMIVLPGPALLIIPLGLVVLASEFLFFRRWLRNARKTVFSRKRIAPARTDIFVPKTSSLND